MAAAAAVACVLTQPDPIFLRQKGEAKEGKGKEGKKVRRNGRGTVRGRGGKHDERHPGTSGPTTAKQLRR